MTKILAILALVVATLVPAAAAFAESEMGGADHDILAADQTQAAPSYIGTVAGADKAPAYLDRENGSNNP